MYYSHNQKKIRVYDVDKITWIVNKTNSLHEYVIAMQNGEYVWPGQDPSRLEFLEKHHLAVQTEYRSSKSKSDSGNIASTRSEEMMYTHPIGSPDDGFHAGYYAYLAFIVGRNKTGSGNISGKSGIAFAEAYTG